MYYHSDRRGVVYITTYFFMVYNAQYIGKVFSTLFTVMLAVPSLDIGCNFNIYIACFWGLPTYNGYRRNVIVDHM